MPIEVDLNMKPILYLRSDDNEYDMAIDSLPSSSLTHDYDSVDDSFEKFASMKNQRYFKRELQRHSGRSIYDLIIDIFVNLQTSTKTNLKRSSERINL